MGLPLPEPACDCICRWSMFNDTQPETAQRGNFKSFHVKARERAGYEHAISNNDPNIIFA